MKEWVAMAGLGTGLFVVALVGTLAVQGRLDYEGTRGVPLVSLLFEPTDGAEDPVPDAAADDAGSKSTEPATRGPQARQPIAATRQDGAAEEPGGVGGLFEFPKLDSGFSAEDLERVLHAARKSEEDARLQRARLDAVEADLLARERDLEDRTSAIAEQMMRVDHERERLEQRIAEFERKVLLVERDELRGLREYGRTLASFDPVRAAALVLQEWADEDGRKRIVKVLAVMDPGDADAILAKIDEARIRDVLLQRLRVAHEPRDR